MARVGTHASRPLRPWSALHRFGPWIIVGLVFLIGLATLTDYGATTDEPWRLLWTRRWWSALEAGAFERFAEMPQSYGVAYDSLGRLLWLLHRDHFGGDDEFVVRHGLNLVAGCLALLGTHRLAREVIGSERGEHVALLAMLLLATSPRFYGSAFTNPKDIPFATAAVWAAWACVRLAKDCDGRNLVRAAVLAGVCGAVRPHGVAFFGVAALAVLIHGRDRNDLLRVFAVVALAYACCVLLWPVLWLQPPWHLVTATLELTRHDHGSQSLFAGQIYPLDDAPKLYVVGWLAATLPLPVVLAAPVGLLGVAVTAFRQTVTRTQAFAWGLLALWVLAPCVVPMLRRTTLYDTSRQFLFMVPVLCIFAALAVVQLLQIARGSRMVIAVALALGISNTVVDAVRLHPYQSLYFSPLVGGLRGAEGQYDIAHYSETYLEAFLWLRDHHPGASVHVVGNGSAVASYYAWKHGLRLNTATFEFFLSEVRQGWEDILPGEVIHTISRDGVPLLQIKRVVPVTRPTVAWVRAKQRDEGPPPMPPTDAGWQRITTTDGRFAVQEALQGGDGFIAIPVSGVADAETTLLLCSYLGLTVWLDGELIYDAPEVPFHYRGTEDFPSLNPVTVRLDPGAHWLVADLSRARLKWKFGVFGRHDAVRFGAGAEVAQLDVGHRSTRPIMQLADTLVGETTQGGRPGENPSLIHIAAGEPLVDHVANIIRTRHREVPNAHVCVVTYWPKVARTLAHHLRAALGDDGIPVRIGHNRDFAFDAGVTVTNMKQIKGLEFDDVLILDPAESCYPNTDAGRRELYTLITRAKEHLDIVCEGQPTSLLDEARKQGLLRESVAGVPQIQFDEDDDEPL